MANLEISAAKTMEKTMEEIRKKQGKNAAKTHFCRHS